MTLFSLLALEILFLSVTIIALYRLKARFGLALLFVFVGSMQYLQAVLAAVFYIRVGDLSFSPGSAVLFSSSLFAILLVYLKEGIPQARTLIYGIVLSNVAVTVVSSITDLQIHLLRGAVDIDAAMARLFVLDSRLFVVGTLTVALDAFLIIIAYEFLLFKVRGLRLFGRILVSMLGVLYVDSVVFTTGTFLGNPVYGNVLTSHLVAKTFAGLIFSIVLWVYLGVVDRTASAFLESRSGEFRDVFSIISYQEQHDRLHAATAAAEEKQAWAEAEARVLLDETERSRAALLSILEDERQTRMALSVSEARLNEAQRSARIGSWLYEPDGTSTWSDEMHELFNLPRDVALTDEVVLSVIHPEDLDASYSRSFARALESGAVDFEAEYRVVGAEGRILTMQSLGKINRDHQGRVVNAVGTVQDITERKQTELALRLANERLQSLSHRLLEIQETERRQIARELHDEIGQTLTATKINLQLLQRYPEPATIMERISDSVAIVERALHQVRSLSLELRPPLLDDLGLAAALRWLADQQARLTGLSVENRCGVAHMRFDTAVETACFRVAQEALTNIARHAGARHAVVELQIEDSELHLRVRDDGTGFDVTTSRRLAAQGASLGLLGMEERATLAGGGIEWRSAPGEGAEVHAWFPLRDPAESSACSHVEPLPSGIP